MSITTRIYGYIYSPDGTKQTTGKLIVSLMYDFVSIDGYKIAPFLTTCTLNGTTGLIDFDLAATENEVAGSIYGQPYPLGVTYQFEFDPNPSDTSTPVYRKDGYWKALYSIPHVSDTVASNEVGFGALVQALSYDVTASASYVLTGDARMLTQEQKDGLTDGGNADDLHVHTPLSSDYVTLGAVADPGVPPANSCYIYVSASGVSPNRVLSVLGVLDDDSTYIIGSLIS